MEIDEKIVKYKAGASASNEGEIICSVFNHQSFPVTFELIERFHYLANHDITEYRKVCEPSQHVILPFGTSRYIQSNPRGFPIVFLKCYFGRENFGTIPDSHERREMDEKTRAALKSFQRRRH